MTHQFEDITHHIDVTTHHFEVMTHHFEVATHHFDVSLMQGLNRSRINWITIEVKEIGRKEYIWSGVFSFDKELPEN